MKTVGIVTKYNDNCIFCGRPTTEEHHLLFGNGFRKLAEEDGIKIHLYGAHIFHTDNEDVWRYINIFPL